MTAADAGPLKFSFPPVVDGDTRLLVLGSLPGEISLARGQYYANPRNQFWRLMEVVTGAPMPEAYEARLARLLEHRIGLWDVVGAATRPGSLDGAIRDHRANRLGELVARLPSLRAVAFNGGKASAIGRAELGAAAGLAFITLPSSSPAYTLAFEQKAMAWRSLRAHLA